MISRLTAGWQTEYARWQHRDLSARRYVYIWADGVYLQARMEPEAECIFVVIGATPEGKKDLVGFHVGRRERAQSWRELLVDLKARGLAVAPEIAVGDGALGFWNALVEAFPGTRHQRCWMHKVSNVLGKFPTSMAPTVKSDLRDGWQAETRSAAEAAIDTFAEKYGTKYDKAVDCLARDREALLAFLDIPAEHWDHLRTANPIESVFATVRHRTVRTKGALSQKTAKLMVFTLVRAASKKWRRLKADDQLPLVVDGIKFTDGVAVGEAKTRAAFFGCRPYCKKFLTVLVRTRVRSSFRPLYAALSEAAGRYGDPQNGSKSDHRAFVLVAASLGCPSWICSIMRPFRSSPSCPRTDVRLRFVA